MSKNVVMTIQGNDIHGHDDMVCLTDMWKSQGADDSKKPADWARKEGHPFIEFMDTKGRNGNTVANWKVAMAYAKYLSPSFHAHVNETYRNVTVRGEWPTKASFA